MKSTKLFFVLASLFLIMATAQGQEKGNGEITRETRKIEGFSRIDVGGAATLIVSQGDSWSVEVETDANLQDNVFTDVDGDMLYIKTQKIRKLTELNVYVTLPELKFIDAHGASDVNGKTAFSTSEFVINASGASNVKLNLDVDYLESDISGASDVILSGKATTHNLVASGASTLKAGELESEKVVYDLSGASDAKVNVTREIKGNASGASDLSYSGSPEVTAVSNKGDSNAYRISSRTYDDSVKVKVGKINVEVFEGDDSVRITFGNKELRIDEDGNVDFSNCKKEPKFNGHWAGFDLGLNGYLNSDNNQKMPFGYDYLDLNMSKSWAASLNFYEQNIALSKSQKLGMVTGLGFTWNNYRFNNDTRLSSDSSRIVGFIAEGVNMRKTKLTTFYLTVPLMMEFQTNSKHNKNSFHIGTGVVGGLRLTSHTKVYYDERKKDYQLTYVSPETGEEQYFTATSPDKSKVKDFDDFHLQPFKLDATVRIGWGKINLYANYALIEMFRKDKGPELYPWSVGITLSSF